MIETRILLDRMPRKQLGEPVTVTFYNRDMTIYATIESNIGLTVSNPGYLEVYGLQFLGYQNREDHTFWDFSQKLTGNLELVQVYGLRETLFTPHYGKPVIFTNVSSSEFLDSRYCSCGCFDRDQEQYVIAYIPETEQSFASIKVYSYTPVQTRAGGETSESNYTVTHTHSWGETNVEILNLAYQPYYKLILFTANGTLYYMDTSDYTVIPVSSTANVCCVFEYDVEEAGNAIVLGRTDGQIYCGTSFSDLSLVAVGSSAVVGIVKLSDTFYIVLEDGTIGSMPADSLGSVTVVHTGGDYQIIHAIAYDNKLLLNSRLQDAFSIDREEALAYYLDSNNQLQVYEYGLNVGQAHKGCVEYRYANIPSFGNPLSNTNRPNVLISITPPSYSTTNQQVTGQIQVNLLKCDYFVYNIGTMGGDLHNAYLYEAGNYTMDRQINPTIVGGNYLKSGRMQVDITYDSCNIRTTSQPDSDLVTGIRFIHDSLSFQRTLYNAFYFAVNDVVCLQSDVPPTSGQAEVFDGVYKLSPSEGTVRDMDVYTDPELNPTLYLVTRSNTSNGYKKILPRNCFALMESNAFTNWFMNAEEVDAAELTDSLDFSGVLSLNRAFDFTHWSALSVTGSYNLPSLSNDLCRTADYAFYDNRALSSSNLAINAALDSSQLYSANHFCDNPNITTVTQLKLGNNSIVTCHHALANVGASHSFPYSSFSISLKSIMEAYDYFQYRDLSYLFYNCKFTGNICPRFFMLCLEGGTVAILSDNISMRYGIKMDYMFAHTTGTNFNGGEAGGSYNPNSYIKISSIAYTAKHMLDSCTVGYFGGLTFIFSRSIALNRVEGIFENTQSNTDTRYGKVTSVGTFTNLFSGIDVSTLQLALPSIENIFSSATYLIGGVSNELKFMPPVEGSYVPFYAQSTTSTESLTIDNATYQTKLQQILGLRETSVSAGFSVVGMDIYVVNIEYNDDAGTPTITWYLFSGFLVPQPDNMNPTKSGYTFGGFYFGTQEWDFSTSVVTQDTTISAKWVGQNSFQLASTTVDTHPVRGSYTSNSNTFSSLLSASGSLGTINNVDNSYSDGRDITAILVDISDVSVMTVNLSLGGRLLKYSEAMQLKVGYNGESSEATLYPVTVGVNYLDSSTKLSGSSYAGSAPAFRIWVGNQPVDSTCSFQITKIPYSFQILPFTYNSVSIFGRNTGTVSDYPPWYLLDLGYYKPQLIRMGVTSEDKAIVDYNGPLVSTGVKLNITYELSNGEVIVHSNVSPSFNEDTFKFSGRVSTGSYTAFQGYANSSVTCTYYKVDIDYTEGYDGCLYIENQCSSNINFTYKAVDETGMVLSFTLAPNKKCIIPVQLIGDTEIDDSVRRVIIEHQDLDDTTLFVNGTRDGVETMMIPIDGHDGTALHIFPRYYGCYMLIQEMASI